MWLLYVNVNQSGLISIPMTGPLLIASLLAATMNAQANAVPAPSRAQCEVAWVYAEMEMAVLRSDPIVFATEPLFLAEVPSRPSKFWRNGRADHVPGPSMALLAAVTNQNVVPACPLIRQRLTARHVRYGEAAVQGAMVPRPGDRHGDGYRAIIISISLPVISADGGHAVLAVTTVAGPLGGGGRLIHLERGPDGRWQEVGWLGLWIS